MAIWRLRTKLVWLISSSSLLNPEVKGLETYIFLISSILLANDLPYLPDFKFSLENGIFWGDGLFLEILSLE
jgi:hypothetical protein